MKRQLFSSIFLVVLIAYAFTSCKKQQSEPPSIPLAGSWKKLAGLPISARPDLYFNHTSAGFSIGTKGYLAAFNWDTDSINLWEYNPDNDQWIKKASILDFCLDGPPYCFSIDDKGYLLTQEGNLWEYDPVLNNWTQKAKYIGDRSIDIKNNGICFIIGTKAYLGMSRIEGETGYDYKNLWEYDPAGNIWTKKTDYPGDSGTAFGFSIGGKGYVGKAINDGATVSVHNFWEYDPATDAWTEKTEFPKLKRNGVLFSRGGKGYCSSYTLDSPGQNKCTTLLWEYNPDTDKWVNIGAIPGGGDYNGIVFSIGAKEYVSTVRNYHQDGCDFWEFQL